MTDVDGVLLRLMPTFEDWVRSLGIAPANPQGRTIAEYLALPDEVASRMVEAFFYDERMEQLEAHEEPLQVLPRLYDAGWRFVAITAIPGDPEIVARRRRNLERVFGLPFEAVHCVGFCADKSTILDAYSPTVWVEDHVENAEIGAAIGHRSFLIDAYYNRHFATSKAQRVSGWAEIEQALV